MEFRKNLIAGVLAVALGSAGTAVAADGHRLVITCGPIRLPRPWPRNWPRSPAWK